MQALTPSSFSPEQVLSWVSAHLRQAEQQAYQVGVATSKYDVVRTDATTTKQMYDAIAKTLNEVIWLPCSTQVELVWSKRDQNTGTNANTKRMGPTERAPATSASL